MGVFEAENEVRLEGRWCDVHGAVEDADAKSGELVRDDGFERLRAKTESADGGEREEELRTPSGDLANKATSSSQPRSAVR